MKTPFSRTRRFAVAIIALLLASLLFRSQVAQALVIRGDDFMYRGDPVQAVERYRRALAVAPSSETAADRYVFVSMQIQTRESMSRALGMATRYLTMYPDDSTMLADRALCYLHLHRYARAAADFKRAAAASHSARLANFARLSERAERKRQ